MKLLVLGDSDISGQFSDGVTWPQLLQGALRGRYGAAEVVPVRFSAFGTSATSYAEKKMAEHAPDVVVLVLGSFPFTAKFVWLRVERLFGKRAGAWYKRLEDRFDDNTRAGRRGLGSLNRLAHRVAPKVIPGASFTTRERLTENYRELFRTLGRFEDSAIIIMSYPGVGAHARQGNAPAERRIFFADLRAAAELHHYVWVDGVEAFAIASGVKADELHFNAAGHQVIASAVEAAVAAMVPAPA